MFVTVLKLEIQEGKKEEFIQIAKQMVEGSQKEAGNIEYNLYEDPDEKNTVAFIEKWKDQAALDLHETMDYFTDNIGKLQALVAKAPIENRYEVIE